MQLSHRTHGGLSVPSVSFPWGDGWRGCRTGWRDCGVRYFRQLVSFLLFMPLLVGEGGHTYSVPSLSGVMYSVSMEGLWMVSSMAPLDGFEAGFETPCGSSLGLEGCYLGL